MVTILVDETEKIVAYATTDSINGDDATRKYYVDEQDIPVSLYDLYKYCYSEKKGIYLHPDYEEAEPAITDTDILNVLLGVNE